MTVQQVRARRAPSSFLRGTGITSGPYEERPTGGEPHEHEQLRPKPRRGDSPLIFSRPAKMAWDGPCRPYLRDSSPTLHISHTHYLDGVAASGTSWDSQHRAGNRSRWLPAVVSRQAWQYGPVGLISPALAQRAHFKGEGGARLRRLTLSGCSCSGSLWLFLRETGITSGLDEPRPTDGEKHRHEELRPS